MNLETLLSCLYHHRKAVAEKLDADSRKQLIDYIQDALKTKSVSKAFSQFCGSNLSEFVMSEKLGSKDKGKLTPPPPDIEKIANELVKVLKQPKPEVKPSEDKKK
jgi:hypothetical protein